MAEVTRVPLPDIAKGSMAKFILGVLVGAALASAVAWFLARPDTVDVDVITAGEGANPTLESVVLMDYTGKLEDGTVFQESPSRDGIPPQIAALIPEGGLPMAVSGVIPGLRDALLEMQVGGRYTVEIPAELAYGASPPAGSPIPPNANLIFDVTLYAIKTQEEMGVIEQQAQAIMMELQGAEGGAAAPGAPAAPPAPPAE